MKRGPFQLQQSEFPTIELRANANIDQKRVSEELPVSVSGLVSYDGDGIHFAALTIQQDSKEYAYSLKIQVFTSFRIDADAARDMFSPYNPAVVGVNVIRILYSGAREMLAVVSSRAPYGAAVLPTLFIESSDITLEMEEARRAEILARDFLFTEEQIAYLNEALTARKAEKEKRPKAKKPSRKKVPGPVSKRR